MQHFPLVIHGGGLVGNSLAGLLREFDFPICIIEGKQNTLKPQQQFIALSKGSKYILQQANFWQAIEPHTTLIQSIHVSDQSRFAKTLIEQEEIGYVIDAAILQQKLSEQMQHLNNVTVLQPYSIDKHHYDAQHFIQAGDHQLTCDLLIGADGAHSLVRDLAKISAQKQPYQQTALTTTIMCEHHHQHRAYERFTKTGAIALLPLAEKQMAVVWVEPNHIAENLFQQNEDELIQTLQQNYGYPLGIFSQLGMRTTYPLHLITSQSVCKNGSVLLGNAAQMLHPIAAQGLNLGLRDAHHLAQQIKQFYPHLHDARLLKQYTEQRLFDRKKTIGFTDKLPKLFHHQSAALIFLRQSIMSLLDLSPMIQNYFSKIAMGISI